MGLMNIFRSSEAAIIQNKKEGVVYVADFTAGKGKYISIAEAGHSSDLDVKISPRINLRVTYLANSNRIEGVEIAKVDGSNVEKIHFSTLDHERILQLLSLFADMDLKAIANKSIVLDETVIKDPEALQKALNLIATDPQGKEKLAEVANNHGLIEVGDIDSMAQKRKDVVRFEKMLDEPEEFNDYKNELGVKKNEEVWQRFFSKNSWILGSDFVDILDERQVDVDNITDYLLKTYDGFVDIVELKLPTEEFWTNENIPRSELTAATMQCSRYILQTERKINDLEFNKKINNTPIVKPRITLIYGRSKLWDNDKKEAYRVLNSSYSNLNIISYDHLLERAKRLVGIIDTGVAAGSQGSEVTNE